jgi:hypothetical protein
MGNENNVSAGPPKLRLVEQINIYPIMKPRKDYSKQAEALDQIYVKHKMNKPIKSSKLSKHMHIDEM